MNKSFVLTHMYKPEVLLTLGVDDHFIRVLEIFYIDVSEVSQDEFETFLGIISVLKPELTIRGSPLSKYVLRYV